MAIKLENVTKKYGKKVVLKDVNFNIPKNKITALIGSNGSGKSTLLKMILNLIKSYDGNINIEENLDVFGLVEDINFYSFKSGLENLKSLLTNKEFVKAKRYILFFEMEGYIKKKIRTYSMGMKQRLSLVLAFSKDSKIIVFDEAINFLDAKAIKKFKNLLLEERENGKTLVLVTHHITNFLDFCDFIYVINEKKIILHKIDSNINYNVSFEFINDTYALKASEKLSSISYEIRNNVIYAKIEKNKLNDYIRILVGFNLNYVKNLKNEKFLKEELL